MLTEGSWYVFMVGLQFFFQRLIFIELLFMPFYTSKPTINTTKVKFHDNQKQLSLTSVS